MGIPVSKSSQIQDESHNEDALFNKWFCHLQYRGEMSKSKAEEILSDQKSGTFLIWKTSTNQSKSINDQVLTSIFTELNLSIQRGHSIIKHYRIRRLDEGGFFITRRAVFNTLKELVDYYRKDSDGLCCLLRTACTQLEKPQIDINYEKFDDDNFTVEIPIDSITFKEVLGQSYFSLMQSGTFSDSSLSVAIKTISKKFADTEKGETVSFSKIDQRLFFKMINLFIFNYQHHPNIVQLYGVCTSNVECVYIFTELMTKGDLLSYLRWGDGKKLQVYELVDISVQIASAMSYLEEHGLMHTRLLTQKVLLGANNTCKLSAFGFPCLREPYDHRHKEDLQFRFPFKYTAPEVIISECMTIKSDVWSFGIVLIDIFSYGKPLYRGMNKFDILGFLKHGNRLACPDNTPNIVYQLMLECWKWDPPERPTFNELHYCLLNLLKCSYLDTCYL